MKEYRVEVKVKNNKFLKKIEERGYKSVGEFCRINNKMNWTSRIGELVNLKAAPLNSEGSFTPFILEICDLLLCSPEDLFSEEQLTTALQTNKRTLEIGEAEAKFMLSNSVEPLRLEDALHNERLTERISALVDTLTPREQKIIEKIFGLNGECVTPKTDIAKELGCTPSRVAQIEAKAIRKLRLPYRSKAIKEDYYDE